MVSVAQLVRALDCGSRGWGFETPHSPHLITHIIQSFTLCSNYVPLS